MSEVGFLAFSADPFGAEPPIGVLTDAAGAHSIVRREQLGDLQAPVVTFEAWRLVDALRESHTPLPRCLIDIRDALRMLSGRSKDQGGERYWDVKRALSIEGLSQENCRAGFGLVSAACERPEPQEVVRLLAELSATVGRLWQALLPKLEGTHELTRFMDVEVPVRQIFWHRQHEGIAIDSANMAESLLSG